MISDLNNSYFWSVIGPLSQTDYKLSEFLLESAGHRNRNPKHNPAKLSICANQKFARVSYLSYWTTSNDLQLSLYSLILSRVKWPWSVMRSDVVISDIIFAGYFGPLAVPCGFLAVHSSVKHYQWFAEGLKLVFLHGMFNTVA